MKRQKGFTLIELVVVIVILGIMAAIAVPKFVDITLDAHNSAARGVAGAISSGSAINFATRTANITKGVAVGVANVCTAAIAGSMLAGGATTTNSPITLQTTTPTTDDQFQITGTGDCTTATGNATVFCSITPRGTGATAATTTFVCVQ